jgi:hypothetical protein
MLRVGSAHSQLGHSAPSSIWLKMGQAEMLIVSNDLLAHARHSVGGR